MGAGLHRRRRESVGNELDHGLHTPVRLAGAQFGVVELRRYVMRAGRRDELIALFEREFIESQEACRMVPIGHYRDLDDAEAFVWFRGFKAMETRREALEAFYQNSPAWLNHRDAANATMIDSDNVLLLRPARPYSGFDLSNLRRMEPAQTRPNASFVGVAVLMLSAPADEACIAAFEGELLPELERSAQRVAYFVTEQRPNDYPRLPVSENWAFVATGVATTRKALNQWSRHFDELLPAPLRTHLIGREFLRLEPATRALFC